MTNVQEMQKSILVHVMPIARNILLFRNLLIMQLVKYYFLLYFSFVVFFLEGYNYTKTMKMYSAPEQSILVNELVTLFKYKY